MDSSSIIGMEMSSLGQRRVIPPTPIPEAPIPMIFSDMECDDILPTHSSPQDVMPGEYGIDGHMSLSNILVVDKE